ncbi:TipAS antibiotic-recognition domain-containing protein [Kitasatospora sp. NPDC008115]|uniref:TipAS antibiotic-recognition domain-containing protein n=1 Tax=Kitasatospora sp. NPDC008115 TaxID=3364022 RepID=UPI0036E841A8
MSAPWWCSAAVAPRSRADPRRRATTHQARPCPRSAGGTGGSVPGRAGIGLDPDDKADRERIKAETDALNARLAELFTDGGAATDAAEAHRQHIRENLHDGTFEIHRGIAGMYLADPRFTKVYEDLAPGLAQWRHDAMPANADLCGGGQE